MECNLQCINSYIHRNNNYLFGLFASINHNFQQYSIFYVGFVVVLHACITAWLSVWNECDPMVNKMELSRSLCLSIYTKLEPRDLISNNTNHSMGTYAHTHTLSRSISHTHTYRFISIWSIECIKTVFVVISFGIWMLQTNIARKITKQRNRSE